MHHPSRDELAAFARGRLTGSGFGEVESHLEECDSCAALLNHFSEDSFLAALRDAVRSTPGCAPTTPAEPPTRRTSADTLSHCAAGEAPSEHTDLPACKLPGHPQYRIVGLLGRGGMGVVYRAEEQSVGREVAVKVLRDCYRDTPAAGRRFLAEAGVTARLQHPGIPPVFQVGTLPDGAPFLAMKLIAGRTLAELLAAPDKPNTSELVTVFEHVCHAVGYAHSRGVIHRDLKPANVMVGEFGEVQVMDWGLAKELLDAEHVLPTQESGPGRPATLTPEAGDSHCDWTHAGAVLGTPPYMAPEQARGDVARVDRRADVYGLGAILCEILTGAPPFAMPSAEEALRAARAGELEPAFVRLDGCGESHELVTLCKRCLAPNPDGRPMDAAEVTQAVADLRAGTERRARQAELDRVKAEGERARAQTKARELRKRQKVQLVLAATVGLLVAGVGAAAWWQDRQAAARRTADILRQSEDDQRTGRNREAVAILLERAEAAIAADDAISAAVLLAEAEKRSAEGGTEQLAARLKRCSAALKLLIELDQIDDRRWTAPGFECIPEPLIRQWELLFRQLGIVPGEISPDAAAGLINGSLVRERLLAALELWLLIAPEPNRAPLAAVLSAADPDQYRSSFRRLWASRDAKDRPVLERLLADDRLLSQPPRFGAAIAEAGPVPSTRRLAILSVVTRTRPRDFAVLMTAASRSYPANDQDKAGAAEMAGWFRVALAVRPSNLAAWHGLSFALNKKGDREGARACYREAIRQAPQHGPTHLMLACMLLEDTEWDGAITHFREALRCERKPSDPYIPREYLGHALKGKGDLEGAIVVYREASRLAPARYDIAHFELADALAEQGDLDGAVAAYREALKRSPSHAVAQRNLQRLERVAALTPRLPEVLSGRLTLTPVELCEFADHCGRPHHAKYALAVVLFRGALARDQKLVPAFGYQAARVAVHVASGKDSEMKSVGWEEWGVLMGLAHGWLRVHLATLGEKVADPSYRARIRADAATLKADPTLEPVRAKEFLAGMTPADRKQWEAFWADVDALLARAR